MKNFLRFSIISAGALAIPISGLANDYNTYGQGYNAHQECKSNEDRRQVIGGVLGAVAGGVLGSQVSGNGARTEGSAIGAVVGGLAGAGIADKTVDCDPVYATDRSYSSGTAYSGNSTHSSGNTYSSGHTTYSTNRYPDRVVVSDHPVYNDPTYGARYSRTVIPESTYARTIPTQTVYAQPTTTRHVYTQPVQTHTTRPYSSYQPAPQYVSRTVQSPRYSHIQYQSEPVRYTTRRGHHHHGRYACNSHH